MTARRLPWACLLLLACGSDGGAARTSTSSSPSAPASASSSAKAPTSAGASAVAQGSAPRAPSRAADFSCSPHPPGTKKVYERANGNDCRLRGGHVEAVDSPGVAEAGRHPVALCKHDDCTTDKSCGADWVCACGAGSGKPGDHNRCVFGNCTSDADCGGFACVEDRALGIPSQPDGYGVIGRYCRSAADTCAADCDCPRAQSGEQCVFSGGAFRCAL